MEFLERLTVWLNRILMVIAGAFLGAMMLLTCANIFLRIVWVPIRGTFELMGYFGAVVTAFALGYAQLKRGHISVDILVQRFSPRLRRVLNTLNALLCTAFFILVAWQLAKYATTLLETGEVTETLRIIYYPFTYGVALGCAVLALVFLTELVKSLMPAKEEAP